MAAMQHLGTRDVPPDRLPVQRQVKRPKSLGLTAWDEQRPAALEIEDSCGYPIRHAPRTCRGFFLLPVPPNVTQDEWAFAEFRARALFADGDRPPETASSACPSQRGRYYRWLNPGCARHCTRTDHTFSIRIPELISAYLSTEGGLYLDPWGRAVGPADPMALFRLVEDDCPCCRPDRPKRKRSPPLIPAVRTVPSPPDSTDSDSDDERPPREPHCVATP